MSTRTRVIKASSTKIWEILDDGWLYPLFVVGASRMRDVDESWPEPGARLHHSVGAWPALIDDTTSVEVLERGSSLTLKARGWPAGEARVVIETTPHPDGTEVAITEDATSGPGLLVPKPVRDIQLGWRNTETLRRLAYLAERR